MKSNNTIHILSRMYKRNNKFGVRKLSNKAVKIYNELYQPHIKKMWIYEQIALQLNISEIYARMLVSSRREDVKSEHQ